MNKLRRYDSFEHLKADCVVATIKSSTKKEISLENMFADLRKYKIIKRDSSKNSSKSYGG